MLTHIDDESIENFIRSTWNVESAKHPFQVHIRPELKNIIIGDIKTNDPGRAMWRGPVLESIRSFAFEINQLCIHFFPRPMAHYSYFHGVHT